MADLSYKTFPVFDDFPEIICAFSTRIGGFSEGKYSSLNMGLHTGDDPRAVRKNRQKFYNILGINKKDVALQEQIHSVNVKIIYEGGRYLNTDALFTNKSGVFLTVQTADCIPVFIFDPVNKSIAVVHAGWRGTLEGVLVKTLELFQTENRIDLKNLFVAIGPGIQSTCFEVKSDVFSKFPNRFLKAHHDEQKKYLDLPCYLSTQLIVKGVMKENVYVSEICTHCDSEKFHSYRRDGKNSGRMIGVIGLLKQ